MRSIRATDIGIVLPAGASLVASGGAPKTFRQVSHEKIPTYTEIEKDPGFSRNPGRQAPYDLMVSLPELAKDVRLTGARPAQPYLPLAPAAEGRPGTVATHLDAVFSPSATTSWELDDAGYRRTSGYAPVGDDFVADNVLVMRVKVRDAGYQDPAGNPVPETDLTPAVARRCCSALARSRRGRGPRTHSPVR